ncbi:MAG: shikimate kinase [Gemmataceae bacterium]|nr:shikimate kinase [Gemmataceae bacterium]
MQQLVILIGYRGSGKTTVGKILAERLGWDFLDADTILEARAGKSIRAIFADEGEQAFRDLESAILAELCTRHQVVLATGGGVVMREENQQAMKNGYATWLTASPAALWGRIQADSSTAERRPALAGGGMLEVERLLSVRDPLYRSCADLTISVESLSPEEAANAILAAWSFHSPKSYTSSPRS